MSKFIDKILDSMKINEDDEYEDGEDEYMFSREDDEEPEERPVRSSASPAPSPVQEEDDQPMRFSRKRSQNLVPMRSGRGNMEVCMIKPASVDDARDICDTIISGRAVVINLEGIHLETAQRIIDFTSGACYSLGGNLQKISNYIFIVTPKAIELSGDFQDMPEDETMTFSSFSGAF